MSLYNFVVHMTSKANGCIGTMVVNGLRGRLLCQERYSLSREPSHPSNATAVDVYRVFPISKLFPRLRVGDESRQTN